MSHQAKHWTRRVFLDILARVAKWKATGDADLGSLAAGLQGASDELDTASAGLETEFLAVGLELEKLSSLGEAFVAQSKSLVALATGQNCDDMIFSGAIKFAEDTSGFLVDCRDRTSRMLERLRDFHAEVGHLLAAEREMRWAMTPLTFVQLLFKVESARFNTNVQQVFAGLMREIEALQNQVKSAFGVQFKRLADANNTIQSVIAQLESQTQSLAALVSAQKDRIDASLRHLRTELAANQERDSRLVKMTREIADKIGSIVVGLQFQDIVNQKLRHVQSAIPAIRENAAKIDSSRRGQDTIGALRFLRQSCRLESAQLAAAIEEIGNAEREIDAGVTATLARLTEIDSRCLTLADFKLLTTSFDGEVQILLEIFDELRQMVVLTVRVAAQAHELLLPLGGAASDLTATVRDISARIHLIGLNGQVQAALTARDNSGSSLETLSARMSEISQETSQISRGAATRLDKLTAGLRESVEALGAIRNEAEARQAGLNGEGCEHERRLHQFRDSALGTLDTIGATLESIEEQGRKTLSANRLARFHQSVLPAARQPLVDIADRAEAVLLKWNLDLGSDSLIDGLAGVYTMASERDVFAQVDHANRAPKSAEPVWSDAPATTEKLSEPALKAGARGEASSTRAATDGFGANVELF